MRGTPSMQRKSVLCLPSAHVTVLMATLSRVVVVDSAIYPEHEHFRRMYV